MKLNPGKLYHIADKHFGLDTKYLIMFIRQEIRHERYADYHTKETIHFMQYWLLYGEKIIKLEENLYNPKYKFEEVGSS